MYNVHQHWDPLKVCIVGKSYSPQFYSFIKDSHIRSIMERIATETEEDYQKLITLLESFGVKVLRPDVKDDWEFYYDERSKRIRPPPMTPRDYSAMIGSTFFIDTNDALGRWEDLKGSDWGNKPTSVGDVPEWVSDELSTMFGVHFLQDKYGFASIIDHVSQNATISLNNGINSAMTSRVGRDLYFGTERYDENLDHIKSRYQSLFPDYRCHVVNTGGHSDGTYCPVKPGLIVSLLDVPTYQDTYPDWEVVYLPGQTWGKLGKWEHLKSRNRGKWWVPGEELNDEFTDYVEQWLGHWVGFVEETVFDVNMLVIDEKNVICNNYNDKVFEAFERHGITPHVCNFRHRFFWDGGLHCITSDVHREGTQKDYFPERK